MHKTSDKKAPTNNFIGMYRGIVRINDDDELLAGRIRVQVYPMHSGIEDYTILPYAIPADTNMSNQNTGGMIIPDVDTHVFVFFENGDFRYPVYFASAPAIQGGVSDIPLATQGTDTAVNDAINAGAEKGIPKAGGGTWDEMDSASAVTYPNNKAYRSTNGMLIEIDDSGDDVRFHVYHPTGTRNEVDTTGNLVEHVVGEKMTITIGNASKYTKGDSSKTVDGDSEEYVKGDVTEKVDGKVKTDVANEVVITLGATLDINVTGATTLISPTVQVTGNVTTTGTVDLDDGGGGIVTTTHLCAFTGAPHPDGSSTCTAKK